MKLCENLSTVEEEFIQLIESFNTKVRDQKIDEGSWSAKDVLSHIVGWEVEVVKQFKAFLLNPDVDDNYDIDSFNKNSVEFRKHIPWADIVDELRSAQKELLDFLTSVNQIDIENEKRFIEWIEILVDHYSHHTDQLKQLP
ncbi:MAG: DinB family protein [Bacteroidetes bacterium]|nr:DinB family protein [Bacteroidota bacterium]